MADNTTTSLGLVSPNPIEDPNNNFDTDKYLKNNWDKIDTAVRNKIDKTQIKNTLTETTAGNVLDATQGKNLNDRLVSLENLTETTETLTINSIGSFTAAVKNGQFNDLKVSGQSVYQIVNNGNFANGSTGWTAVGATMVVANNTLSLTGGSTYADNQVGNQTTWAVVVGNKVFIKAKVRVTNSNCTKLSLTLAGSGGGWTEKIVQTSPAANTWYYVTQLITIPSGFSGNVRIGFIQFYADIATATGKVMELQEVMAVDMGTTAETVDQVSLRFPTWLKYGIVSTISGRLTAAKNIFGGVKAANKIVNAVNNATYAYKTSVDGRNCIALKGNGAINAKIVANKFEPNTQYTVQFFAKTSEASSGGIFTLLYTDGTHEYLGPSSTAWTKIEYTSTVNKSIDRIELTYASFAVNYYDYDTMQVEKGTTATAVDQSYSEAYTQDLATKWDSFSVLTGFKTIGGNNKVLQASDVTSIVTTGTNVDLAVITKPTDAITFTSGGSEAEIIGSFKVPWGTWDNVSQIGGYYLSSNGYIYYVVAKGTTIAQAQAALTGKTVSYQLAVPNYTYHPIGNLKAGALYTLISEPYIKDEGYYNTKVNIVAGAAKSIDWVNKIDVTNQVFTPVDMSKVILASDGLSFTITGAVTGDWYEYGAFPVDGSSTYGDVTAKASTSIGSSVDANTDAAILLTKEVNSLRIENSLMKISADNHAKDYTLQVPYGGTTTGTANTYAISTPTITSLTAGMAISLKFNLDSTGASTLNWCGLGAKGIKKANGTDATNLKASGIYTLRYDGTNFILQGEGGEYGTATADKVLTGFSIGTDGGLINGTMANNGTVTIAPSNAEQTITQGYHNGAGKVAAVTFDATKLLTGTTVANTPGSMPNNGVQSATLDVNTNSKTIPLGYTTGGTISIVPESKTVTPNETVQTITPTSGKVLSAVTVNPVDIFTISASDTTLATMLGWNTNDVLTYSSPMNTPIAVGSGFLCSRIQGIIRISFTTEARGGDDGETGTSPLYMAGAVFKNGVQVGTTRINEGGTLTYTEDFACSRNDIFIIKVWKTRNGQDYGESGRVYNILANGVVSYPQSYSLV